MSETVKTSVFAAAALVVALAAFGSVYLSRPAGVAPPEEIGKPIFEEFTDPLKGASLEIVSADAGGVQRFEVEQGSDGRWIIPSHGGYPADAENRVRDAAVALMDLKILGVATDRPADHKLFGVVEPTSENAGEEGVGTLVAMQDADRKDLVRLVVGHKIKGNDAQRFVRRPRQDRVYAVEINLDSFPAKFEDWIEKDLLKLNPLDLKKLTISDYSAQAAVDVQGYLRAKQNRRMDLTAVTENSKWTLESLTLYQRNQPQASSLLPDEELNETKLNDVKNGLDELKIVDVRRKPQGLGADLKADRGFFKDKEGLQSLIELGFIPDAGRNQDQDIELYAENGDVTATLKNGVEYVLKFGRVSGAEEDKLNRYLLVMARVNESMIPKPELAELPPLPEAASSEESSSGEAEDEEEQAPATSSEQKSDEAAADDPAKKEKQPPAKPADDRAKIEAERERIAKENERKQSEYDEKVKEANKEVRDLNFRFADWYYVVSEDVFKKIRLTRSDAIKEKESAEDEGYGVDAFRALEEEGLKKEEAKKPATTPPLE
jgi:hypothetical protein